MSTDLSFDFAEHPLGFGGQPGTSRGLPATGSGVRQHSVLRQRAGTHSGWTWLKAAANCLRILCLMRAMETDRGTGRERGRRGVMYSYQSCQSSAAVDKQKCEGQWRCRGLIDMAGAQRITHTRLNTPTHTFCFLHLNKHPLRHHCWLLNI